MKENDQGMTRRGFLGLGAAAAASAALAACGGTSEPEAGGDAGSGSAAAPSGSEYIRFGCEAAYAPYEWKQAEENEFTLPISNLDGQFADGYDIQLDKMIGEKLGRTPVVVNMSFTGLIAALENDQIDAICAGMSATEERKASVDFSHPYLSAAVAIMVASDSQWADATSLEDFRGASILGQKNSLPDSVIDQIPEVVHLDPVDFIPDSIARLLEGTVDGVVVDANNKGLYEGMYPGYTVIVFEEGKGFDTPGVDPCVAVLKGDPQGILDAINEVIDALTPEDRQQLWDECTARSPE